MLSVPTVSNTDDARNFKMIDFMNLSPEELAGISITLPVAHLLEFADSTAEKAVNRFKEEVLPLILSADKDPLIPRKEVMRILKVCANTLRNWRESKYLEAVIVGRKVFYRTSAVNKVLDEYGKEH